MASNSKSYIMVQDGILPVHYDNVLSKLNCNGYSCQETSDSNYNTVDGFSPVDIYRLDTIIAHAEPYMNEDGKNRIRILGHGSPEDCKGIEQVLKMPVNTRINPLFPTKPL